MPRRPSSHVDDPAAVGRRLREAREAAGLTQRELSFEGCTAAYVSRIEAGARVPSLQILREFGKRLGVSADFLATGSSGEPDLSSQFLEAEVALQLGDDQRATELYEEVEKALKPFKRWQLSWLPHEMNKEADKLVDQAFKGEPVIHATD